MLKKLLAKRVRNSSKLINLKIYLANYSPKMLIFVSGCNVSETTEQNLDIRRDSSFAAWKISPNCMMKKLFGEMVTEELNCEITHSQMQPQTCYFLY